MGIWAEGISLLQEPVRPQGRAIAGVPKKEGGGTGLPFQKVTYL